MTTIIPAAPGFIALEITPDAGKEFDEVNDMMSESVDVIRQPVIAWEIGDIDEGGGRYNLPITITPFYTGSVVGVLDPSGQVTGILHPSSPEIDAAYQIFPDEDTFTEHAAEQLVESLAVTGRASPNTGNNVVRIREWRARRHDPDKGTK